jgi:hypothetical protein
MWFLPMVGGGRRHRLASMVLITSQLDQSTLPEGPQREALRAIVAELGDRLDTISFSDYRALRESSAEPLPSPAAIWEMFGGFHRMRECAAIVAAR